jgi:hypothetical protein
MTKLMVTYRIVPNTPKKTLMQVEDTEYWLQAIILVGYSWFFSFGVNFTTTNNQLMLSTAHLFAVY